MATLFIACATLACADSETVAIVDGQPYSSLTEAAAAAQSGSRFEVVSDAELTSDITIRNGVQFIVPRGVTITSNQYSITSYGNMKFSGTYYRTGSAANTDRTLTINGGTLDLYGSVISSPTAYAGLRVGVNVQEGAIRIFGGQILSSNYSISNASDYDVLIYGGTFSPLIGTSKYTLPIGGQIISTNPTIISWGGLYEVGRIVASGVSWLTLFCAAIVANKLLLIFVIFFMGFAGIGLIRRIIR